MPLSTGTRLGHYDILAPIGSGGMGEVYRARDTRLKRDVALKVLPDAFARDPERMARFQREAELLASLNHPNIATIYGVEERALAMELVEGETLASPLPIRTTLEYARQIAEALEYAHERGVIHRDLKPANVKVTPEGTVKVLDFGLAKAIEDPSGRSEDPANSPTLTAGASRVGVIMGTAAYMSPEQASGRPADRRADIWSFGAVMYEMLTGKLAFAGESISDTLATVLKLEPDWNALPAATPASIRNLVRRCLKKDRKQRLQAIGEARIAIEEALSGVPQEMEAPRSIGPRHYWPWIAATALLAIAVPAAWFLKPEAKPEQPLLQMEINAPEGATLGSVNYAQLALSPDGRRLVFLATTRKDGRNMLWLRPLEGNLAVLLPGTENAIFPFWSPDSRWVAFFAGGKLLKIDVTGGAPQVICDAIASIPRGTWGSDGVILFGDYASSGPIQRVSVSGGAAVPVFELDHGLGETPRTVPYFLPDGKRFLYTTRAKESAFMLGSLDGKTRRVLMPGGGESPVTYARNPAGGGWILYIRGNQLVARPFDPGKGEFTGEAAVVTGPLFGGPSWSASANGFLAFRRTPGARSQLTWFNRDGTQLGTSGDPGHPYAARISPDQKSLAFYDRPNGRNADIWLFDLTRGITTRFTSEPGRYAAYPVWSPDGNHLLYWTRTPNVLVERSVNGIGPETILKSQPNTSWIPTGVSHDGQWVVVLENSGARRRILLAPRPDGKSVPLVEGGDSLGDGSLSPDGRWLLYTFAPGGGRSEVFVQSIPKEAGGSPSAVGKWQISSGGTNPVWRADGKEIFYLALDGKLMVVPVESGENFFRPGTQRPLFQTRLNVSTVRFFGREYDVTPDGQRFLLAQPVADNGDVPITVIVNWPQLLKK